MNGSVTPDQTSATSALWQPSQADLTNSEMAKFKGYFANALNCDIPDYSALHALSLTHSEEFWRCLWAFCKIKGQLNSTDSEATDPPFFHHHWFEKSTLNFAENLLRDNANTLGIAGYDEKGHWKSYTRTELHTTVISLAQWLQGQGIQPGDRIAGYLPNLPETLVAMLASAAIGAIWTSCSPDFGINSVVDRFSQVTPRVLLTVDGYFYKDKVFPLQDKLDSITQALPSLEHVILIPYLQTRESTAQDNKELPLALSKQGLPLHNWQTCVTPASQTDTAHASSPSQEWEFQQFPFNHPLYILYSSGTTGKPKCIVHGAGGTLLQHLKELQLHTDVTPKDTLLYYTSCGWMMWNWMASTLATGATLLTYDGAPMSPTPASLLQLLSDTGVTIFGTSARFIHALNQAGITQAQVDLSKLRAILSTGSPLAPEDFDYVYQDLAPKVRLCSISGGTDIISCFVLGSPLVPIYRGQIQCAGLGMAVEIWNEQGEYLRAKKGELVCTAPFPSMPIQFWNDPEDKRYHAAYFERYAGIWAHGDYAEHTAEGGYIIYGRSDAILNPQGVRIGTAELYNPVQKLAEVSDCLAAPLETQDGDVQIVLFIAETQPTGSAEPSPTLKAAIKRAIVDYASPRHVPKYIVCAPDLPRTHSGKLMEVLVKTLINGETPNNLSAVANPECLAFFQEWSAHSGTGA
jgi:acetoacetyl-CoA synthetase